MKVKRSIKCMLTRTSLPCVKILNFTAPLTLMIVASGMMSHHRGGGACKYLSSNVHIYTGVSSSKEAGEKSEADGKTKKDKSKDDERPIITYIPELPPR